MGFNIRNSESLASFKGNILKFIHPSNNSVILCNNLNGVQLLTSFKLGLSPLQQHTFKHNFRDTLNTICICIKDFETLCIYLLHCSLYTIEREALLYIIQGIDNSILEFGDSHIVKGPLHGRKFLDTEVTQTY